MFKTEMRPAYEWTCDECGRNNFESCIVAEFSDEDRLEQAKAMGLIDEYQSEIPDDLVGDFVTYPDGVTCPSCGAEYATQDMRE